MVYPEAWPTTGTRVLSAHEQVNQAVASLSVVCTGTKNGTLYFEKLPGASLNNDNLALRIIQRLKSAPESVRKSLSSITAISFKP